MKVLVDDEVHVDHGQIFVESGEDECDLHDSRPELDETWDQTDDRYLLQFWPAPPEPARLLKQTSGAAAYWHDFATLPVG
ncbi:hypothetical protein AB0I02_44650 [Streptomyces phaeochromogenes]